MKPNSHIQKGVFLSQFYGDWNATEFLIFLSKAKQRKDERKKN